MTNAQLSHAHIYIHIHVRTYKLVQACKHPFVGTGILTQFVHSARGRYAQYVLIAKLI